MTNIWDARNNKKKTILPHARLITSLINKQKAIPRDAPMVDLQQLPFSLARLARGTEWKFANTPQARILRDTNEGLLVAPKAGFTREEVLAGMNEGGGGVNVRHDEGGEEVPVRRDTCLLGAGVNREIPRVRIEQPDSYAQWSPFEQNMWNLSASQAEAQRAYYEAQQARYEEHRRFERGMAYAHELEIRRRFEYDEQVRHHNDYLANRTIIDNPPRNDYHSLEPYNSEAEMIPYYPQSHDSQWLPRHSSAARLESSSNPSTSSSDPYDMRSMYTSMMQSFFGDPNAPP